VIKKTATKKEMQEEKDRIKQAIIDSKKVQDKVEIKPVSRE
jgi:hypothetical protein